MGQASGPNRWGLPGWRETRGPATLPIGANMPLLGLFRFFSTGTLHMLERPVLLFYRWGSRLLEVKKFVPGHTGSPYQRRMELKLPDCSQGLLMTVPPPRLPPGELRGALHKTAQEVLGPSQHTQKIAG